MPINPPTPDPALAPPRRPRAGEDALSVYLWGSGDSESSVSRADPEQKVLAAIFRSTHESLTMRELQAKSGLGIIDLRDTVYRLRDSGFVEISGKFNSETVKIRADES